MLTTGALPASYIPTVYAEEVIVTVQEHARAIAEEYDVPFSTMEAIIEIESNWGEKMEGDGGKSCGLVHIHSDYFPEEFKRCYDNDFSLRFLAQKIKEGKEYLWTTCSCMQTAKALGVKLPRGNASDLKPNTNYPHVGGVIILKYKEFHAAVIKKVTAGGIYVKEGNFEKCRITERRIDWNDPKIVGYYYPGE